MLSCLLLSLLLACVGAILYLVAINSCTQYMLIETALAIFGSVNLILGLMISGIIMVKIAITDPDPPDRFGGDLRMLIPKSDLLPPIRKPDGFQREI